MALHAQSKADQNNPGAQDPKNRKPRQGHYQGRTFMVFSELYPTDCHGMEFQLTESLHSKDLSRPLTISACYKMQGNLEKSLEAWRILRAAVSGKELDSNIVSKFEEELKALMRGSHTNILTDPPRQVGRANDWMEVSKNFQAFANKRSYWKAVPQKKNTSGAHATKCCNGL